MHCSFDLHPGLVLVQRQSVPLGLLDQLHNPIIMETQNISEYIRIYQNISEYIRIYQNISEYIRIYQNISEYIRIYKNI
jgi:hypothetical protein